MHESDFNKIPADGGKLRTAVIVSAVIGVFMLAGLAVYTWQLQQQIEQLRADSEPSALQSLLESPDVDIDSPPQLLNSSPFNSFPSAPSGSSRQSADPFQQMEEIRQQMNAMMSSVFGGPSPAITGIPGFGLSGNSLFGADPFASLGMNQLTINLRETDETLELVIPVSEGQEFELSTDVQEDRLTVSGTLSWQQQSSQGEMSSQRQGSSQFSRTVVLPDNVDPTGLKTEHRENEIVISLPKV